ncbi:hypothetical protein Tco_1156410 [Tanacetum coccineum]
MKRVNTFVDYKTELVEESSKKAETELGENSKKPEAEIAQESSSKRVGDELKQKNAKKQGDLKIMFEPHVEDQVWKNQDNYSVLD